MQKGDIVQNFVLKNSEGKDHSLLDITSEGKALILFFPLAFSTVCTDEMCTVKDNMKLYNSLNANVTAISIDSFFTLREFKKTYNLNFTMLSDFNKQVSKQFGVLYDDYFGMKGVAKRAAFVINSENKVEYAEILEDSGNMPDFKAIRKALTL
ncbi:MAG: redoxin domain-containing protein [Balneolaceae bacterium]|nr:redoxin domain-containing protein [Balneolaceae bacterium]